MKSIDQEPEHRPRHCQECRAEWRSNTCADAFHQALAWDFQDSARAGIVHHLTVLCYNLQQPGIYSPEGLSHAISLLVEFVEEGKSPVEIRKSEGGLLQNDRRKWAVTARAGNHGAYRLPPCWTMTVLDVVDGGIEEYPQRVRVWAKAVLQALKEAGNI
jgi:hypothetical protein